MEAAFKIGNVRYEVGALTLGDARMIATEFGVRDLSEFDWSRPEYLAALVYLGFRNKHPEKSHAELMADVDGVDLTSLVESVGSEIAAQFEKEVEAAKRAAEKEAAKTVPPTKPKAKKPSAKDAASGD